MSQHAALYRRHTSPYPVPNECNAPQTSGVPGGISDGIPTENLKVKQVGGIEDHEALKRKKNRRRKIWNVSIGCGVMSTVLVIAFLVVCLRMATTHSHQFLEKWQSTYAAYNKQQEVLHTTGTRIIAMEKEKLNCDQELQLTLMRLSGADQRAIDLDNALRTTEGLEETLKNKEAHLNDIIQAFRNQYYELQKLKSETKDCVRDRTEEGTPPERVTLEQAGHTPQQAAPNVHQREARPRSHADQMMGPQ